MKLKVLVQPEAVGGYSVSIPALPGCFSQGESLEDAMANIREAAELWLEVSNDAALSDVSCQFEIGQLQEIEL